MGYSCSFNNLKITLPKIMEVWFRQWEAIELGQEQIFFSTCSLNLD